MFSEWQNDDLSSITSGGSITERLDKKWPTYVAIVVISADVMSTCRKRQLPIAFYLITSSRLYSTLQDVVEYIENNHIFKNKM